MIRIRGKISIKRIIISVLFIVGMYFLVAFLTNPTLEDFDKWRNSECYKEIKETTKTEEFVAVF